MFLVDSNFCFFCCLDLKFERLSFRNLKQTQLKHFFSEIDVKKKKLDTTTLLSLLSIDGNTKCLLKNIYFWGALLHCNVLF